MVEKILLLTFTFVQASTPTPAVNNAITPLTFWVQVGSISAAIIGILTFALTQTWPRIQTRLERRSLQKRIGAQSYTPDGIERSLKYFVTPLFQDTDPSDAEEPGIDEIQQKLYEKLDAVLTNPTSYKYLILLADSGMGKTTALLNYYARHLRKWLKPKYKVALVPLSNATADEQIEAIEDQPNTVLMLDALDEDTLAMVDYKERLRLLLKATTAFRTVVISCRTQFFSKDEEIPKQTGVIKVTARAAGEEAEYYFHKIYLSPFSDKQVNKYIRRRYPIWRRQQRMRAKQMVLKIPHLTARPMLLAHVDDLINTKQEYHYAYELYAAMVKAWIERERGFIGDAHALNQFSERLAVDVFANRFSRKGERIPKPELAVLAKHWNISLEDWKLSGRSLLNRDAEGNFKFAHRSIMEYLFVKSFMAGDSMCTTSQWTDQMKSFLWEMLQQQVVSAKASGGSIPGFLENSLLKNPEGLAILSEIFADRINQIRLFAGPNRRFIPRSAPTLLTLSVLLATILDPTRSRRVLLGLSAFKDDTAMSLDDLIYIRYGPIGGLQPLFEVLQDRPSNLPILGRYAPLSTPIIEHTTGVFLIIAPPHFAPVGVITLQGALFSGKDFPFRGLLNSISNAQWNKRYLGLLGKQPTKFED